MNISQAADASGLPVKTLRHYENIGLVVPGRQQGNEYRYYSPDDVVSLRFLQRARASGFGLDKCRELLDAYKAMVGGDKQVLRACLDELRACLRHLDDQQRALVTLRQDLHGMLALAGQEELSEGLAHSVQGQPMPFLLLDQ